LEGEGRGNAASPGIFIDAADAVTNGTGTITFTGTSIASVAGSHGVSIAQDLDTGTTASVTFVGCSGGVGGDGVNIAGALRHDVDLFSTNCAGGVGGDGVHTIGTVTVASNTIFTTCSTAGNGNAIHIAGPFSVTEFLAATSSITG